ncbi:MAG TPA: cytochrome c3 family protein [Bryobacteraceae bacterium]|nr:cytochrome c3 family protein [Bryobacteraceae bacterium]
MRTVLWVVAAGLFLAGSIWFLRAPQIRPDSVAPSPSPAQAPSASPSAPPDAIVFPASNGNVAFDHKKHYQRVGGDCGVCHPKVFPQSRAPLNYKKASHRAAEASLTSCAYCHAVGGASFAADSNCLKCHVKDYSKP